jgi:hypothetical protein
MLEDKSFRKNTFSFFFPSSLTPSFEHIYLEDFEQYNWKILILINITFLARIA